jgi:hypothetical protein
MTQYDIPQPAPFQERGEDEDLVRGTGRPPVVPDEVAPISEPEEAEVDWAQRPIGWIDL